MAPVQFGNYIGPELGDSEDEEQQPGEYDDDEEGAEEEAEWDETHGLDDEQQQQQQAQQTMSDDTRMVTAAGRNTRGHTHRGESGEGATQCTDVHPRGSAQCAHLHPPCAPPAAAVLVLSLCVTSVLRCCRSAADHLARG